MFSLEVVEARNTNPNEVNAGYINKKLSNILAITSLKANNMSNFRRRKTLPDASFYSRLIIRELFPVFRSDLGLTLDDGHI